MRAYFQDSALTVYHGDALEVLRTLPDESVHCCVTSPPYWGLRDYGVSGQFGLEKTPEEYVSKMVEIFRAPFPPDLIIPCILAGCPQGGTVLDPFAGTGTTGKVAERFERKAILVDINDKYFPLMMQRNRQRGFYFNATAKGEGENG